MKRQKYLQQTFYSYSALFSGNFKPEKTYVEKIKIPVSGNTTDGRPELFRMMAGKTSF